MQSIDDNILIKVVKAGWGSLFLTEDFIRYGSSKAVSKRLQRLAVKEKIYLVAWGVYTRL